MHKHVILLLVVFACHDMLCVQTCKHAYLIMFLPCPVNSTKSMAPKKRPSARAFRRAQERWEETVSKFCKGDAEKRADVEEICNRFPSLQMCIEHARGLIAVAT